MADYVITKPGVYDIPEDAYHADPVPGGSLSQSGAKVLLKEGGPALFAWQREHPKPPTKDMELGTAAHKLVLGTGQELAEVKADNWRGKRAADEAAEAREAGKLPLLTRELATVRAMAEALRGHEWAQRLLSQPGKPEMSAFWPDPDYGVWRRLRWDFMPEPHATRRAVLVDYKTTADAGKAAFARSIANFGYHQQADWYAQGYYELTGVYPAFAFVAQEKEPPYRVAVYQLKQSAISLGNDLNERAIRIYKECAETGEWPGYDPGPQEIDVPVWAYRIEEYS